MGQGNKQPNLWLLPEAGPASAVLVMNGGHAGMRG